MKKVTGIGGIFFKSDDPGKLYAWYEEHLGLKRGSDEAVVFKWQDAELKSRQHSAISSQQEKIGSVHPGR